MIRLVKLGGALVVAALATAACGGGSAAPGTKSADGVGKAGMDQTFAGQNRCNPKNHERPFVIEWDATDMSSFEARAANDVVFVRYQGCDLIVMDSCVSDSVKGALGSYKAVEWTSGSVESLDINSEGELYAKLPLGAASLGGRVHGGEKFHMEYFVSGTRSATRDAIHRSDLAKVAGCKNATHFVYAYNLGAFALGAQSNVRAEAGGTMWGVGAGGSNSSSQKAEKRGGELSTCRAESARETQTCKVPVRLTLREIDSGESADARDSRAPDSPDANNLAGRLAATTDREKQAEEHGRTAEAKLNARDGKGCLAELDQHDQLDPRPSGMSTASGSYLAASRGKCLMLAGQCTAGKEITRKGLEKTAGATMGPDQLDKKTDEIATQFCQGGTMSPRDQFLKAGADLEIGAYKERKDAAYCKAAFAITRRLVATVKPNDSDDPVKFVMAQARTNAPKCLIRAHDCAAAFEVFKEAWKLDPLMKPESRNLNEGGMQNVFDSISNGECPRLGKKQSWEH